MFPIIKVYIMQRSRYNILGHNNNNNNNNNNNKQAFLLYRFLEKPLKI
jgi:hypothetical protein